MRTISEFVGMAVLGLIGCGLGAAFGLALAHNLPITEVLRRLAEEVTR